MIFTKSLDAKSHQSGVFREHTADSDGTGVGVEALDLALAERRGGIDPRFKTTGDQAADISALDSLILSP